MPMLLIGGFVVVAIGMAIYLTPWAELWDRFTTWLSNLVINTALATRVYMVPLLAAIAMSIVGLGVTAAFAFRRGRAAAPRDWFRQRWVKRSAFIFQFIAVFVLVNLFLPDWFTRQIENMLTGIIQSNGAASAAWYLALTHVAVPTLGFVAVKRQWFGD